MEVIVTIVSKLVYNLFTGLIVQPIGVIIHLLSTMDIPVYIQCPNFNNTPEV